MSYTKRGPFVDGGAPYLDAAFFNGLEAALGGAAANTITGWFHVDQYGAVGDGVTDDHAAIQNAINAAHTAYLSTGARQVAYLPPKVHLVAADSYYKTDGSTDGSAVSLYLLDGVDFIGPGTLKVKANAYGSGAHYAAIRSASTGLSHASVRDITIDGNKTNNTASVQCSNIELLAVTDVEVSHTRHVQANGQGIMVYGTTSAAATDVKINRNDVDGCTSIGIQVSQFNGLDIDGNVVSNCGNNGIDVYGEAGTTTSNGINFRIANNRVTACAAGIFPETVANGLVENNHCFFNSESSIHVNRINGAPKVMLQGNFCIGGPVGILITGDMYGGGVYIRGNTITDVTSAGIQMGGGGSTSSNVFIDSNFIDTATPNSTALHLVATGTNVWSTSMIRNTMTRNTNRAYDTVNYATTTTNVSYAAAISPGSF